MSRHLVLGKGPIGTTLAGHLAALGHEVVVVSRTGAPTAGHRAAPVTTPHVSATTSTAVSTSAATRPGRFAHAAAEATDVARLTDLAAGAEAIYNCVNPPYHRWPADWPPIMSALLDVAEATGAVLVTAGNLYGYGTGTRLMREDSPLASAESKGLTRATLWHDADQRHRAGRVRATEVRGSDYLGPGAGSTAHAGDRLMRPLLAGATIRPIGSADQPHTWTYLPDFARALAAAAVVEAAWGSAWHVPSPEPLTFRELAGRFASAAGAPEPRIRPLPIGMVRALGVVSPLMREVAAVGYQFTEPFVMDSASSAQVLGLTPTPWPTIVDATLAAWPSAAHH